MIDHAADRAPTIIALSVNNTRTHLGLCTSLGTGASPGVGGGGEYVVEDMKSVPHADAAQTVAGIVGDARAVVLSSVNPAASGGIRDALTASLGVPVLEINRDVAIPLRHTLTDASTLGQDRALNALGAFARVQQACVVIDAGTAVTVDFVDGEGTFHGGMIVPGVQMMLDALHERTASLPALSFGDRPDPLEPFGKNTEGAMYQGVVAAVRGSVRFAAERYAEFYGAFAQVIATGGDAQALFGEDELVEAIVPGLTLMGIAHAFAKSLDGDGGAA